MRELIVANRTTELARFKRNARLLGPIVASADLPQSELLMVT